MYMFVMRYKPEHCGEHSTDEFLDLVQAEGAPVHRAFTITMSDQPGMKQLARKHPGYFRRLPTPIADQAVEETVFMPQSVFLGSARDMEDIAAAVRKVQKHCAARALSNRAREAA